MCVCVCLCVCVRVCCALTTDGLAASAMDYEKQCEEVSVKTTRGKKKTKENGNLTACLQLLSALFHHCMCAIFRPVASSSPRGVRP